MTVSLLLLMVSSSLVLVLSKQRVSWHYLLVSSFADWGVSIRIAVYLVSLTLLSVGNRLFSVLLVRYHATEKDGYPGCAKTHLESSIRGISSVLLSRSWGYPNLLRSYWASTGARSPTKHCRTRAASSSSFLAGTSVTAGLLTIRSSELDLLLLF